jgi:hypothetical protein
MAAVTPISAEAPGRAGQVAKAGPSRPPARRFSEVLSRTTVENPRPAPEQAKLAGQVLSRVEAGQKRLDEIIAQARSGKTFRPRELLAMQAEVYRISEELSLVNKVVEEGVAGIKRLWNMQV